MGYHTTCTPPVHTTNDDKHTILHSPIWKLISLVYTLHSTVYTTNFSTCAQCSMLILHRKWKLIKIEYFLNCDYNFVNCGLASDYIKLWIFSISCTNLLSIQNSFLTPSWWIACERFVVWIEIFVNFWSPEIQFFFFWQYQSGEGARFITRKAALRKLQLTLRDFRTLCIVKGIYPREPKHRRRAQQGKTGIQTLYLKKDIQFLMHEPIIWKIREKKVPIRHNMFIFQVFVYFSNPPNLVDGI